MAGRRIVRPGDTVDPEELAAWLVACGYTPAEAVESPGEFSAVAAASSTPIRPTPTPRIAWNSSTTSSSRCASSRPAPSAAWRRRRRRTHRRPRRRRCRRQPASPAICASICPPGFWTVLVEVSELRTQGQHYLERVSDIKGLFTVEGTFRQLIVASQRHAVGTAEPLGGGDLSSARRVGGALQRRSRPGARRTRHGGAHRSGADRLSQRRRGAPPSAKSWPRGTGALGAVEAGHRPGPRRLSHVRPGRRLGGIVVLGGQELFRREQCGRGPMPRRRLESRAIDSFLDLAEGDLVVHVSHGIARYRGMQLLDAGPITRARSEEHLVLEFRDGVQRVRARLRRSIWCRSTSAAPKPIRNCRNSAAPPGRARRSMSQQAVMDLAGDMIQLQAMREAQPGLAFPPDSDWQARVRGGLSLSGDARPVDLAGRDQGRHGAGRPMDRLICGDVGYGKTELAIRAAFKAVDNGKQVAVLVPTTVLAEQHCRTFGQRLADYPFVVECLSRFRTAGEQRRISKRLADGSIDVVIGTHRLVSADVQFKDLGPGHHRRGAAFRRRAQGTAQEAAAAGRRADA